MSADALIGMCKDMEDAMGSPLKAFGRLVRLARDEGGFPVLPEHDSGETPSDDPVPWLVAADWLDERGEDGAGFRAVGERLRAGRGLVFCVRGPEGVGSYYPHPSPPLGGYDWRWLDHADEMRDGAHEATSRAVGREFFEPRRVLPGRRCERSATLEMDELYITVLSPEYCYGRPTLALAYFHALSLYGREATDG